MIHASRSGELLRIHNEMMKAAEEAGIQDPVLVDLIKIGVPLYECVLKDANKVKEMAAHTSEVGKTPCSHQE